MSSAEPEGAPAHKPGVKERAREELRKFAIVALYLYVCFGVLMLYKTAVLREAGVDMLALGVAAGKALILGKFLLIGEALGVGSRGAAPTLLRAIARKTIMLFLMLVALSVLEEFLVGWVRGHSFAETLARYEAHSILELSSTCLLLLLVLLPLVAVMELSRTLGPGVLRRLLQSRTVGTGSGDQVRRS